MVLVLGRGWHSRKLRETVLIGCAMSRPRSRAGLPSFKAWKVHYIHTVLYHHPERQHKPKQWGLEKGDITEG
jgi:hypothetical protein